MKLITHDTYERIRVNYIMESIDKLFDNFKSKIGTTIGQSEWININQKIINDFANLTMDKQFIHIDQERALKETSFGSTIAHGFLILSLSTKFFVDVVGEIEGEKMGINYGFNKLRFVNPVKSHDMIRGVFKLKEVTKRNLNEILFTHDLTIEIKNVKKPAIVCEWLNLSIF